jgi:hypothetical protein
MTTQPFNATSQTDAPTKACVAGLRSVVGALEGVFGETDRAFLSIGGELGRVIDTFGGLASLFASLPQELSSEALQNAAHALRAVGREIKAMEEALLRERGALGALGDLNGRLRTRIDAIRQTVGTILHLGVNARIIAAQIGGEKEDFGIFTQEMVRFAATAEQTIKDCAREQSGLTDLLGSAIAKQAAVQFGHKATLRSVVEQLDSSLAMLETHQAEAAAGVRDIEGRSDAVRRAVADTVTALQINDITRQRIEHVCHALGAASEGLSQITGDGSGDGWHSDLSEPQARSVAAGVCRLQSAQIVHTEKEFDHEAARIGDALTKLSSDAAAIVSLAHERLGGGADRKAGESLLDDLERVLAATGALLQSFQTARAEVDRVASAAGISLAKLLDRVNAIGHIESDMRLVGLNTALKCGRLGDEGRVLTVVAQEVRLCAGRISEDADHLRALLQEIVASSAALDDGRREHGADRVAALETTMNESLAIFRDSGRRLGTALARLSEEGRRTSAILQGLRPHLAVRDKVSAALKAAERNLEDLAGRLGSGTDDAALIGQKLGHFGADRYTMASEREIHARLFTSRSQPAAIVQPAAQTSLDDILF